MNSNELSIIGISPFKMNVRHLDMSSEDIIMTNESHIHAECEIYINLTGNVSFMVENSIYPIYPGNVIITRPYEYHHCIYHTRENHEHFWILFQPGENKWFLDMFYERPAGKGNRLCMQTEDQAELITLCKQMLSENLSELEKNLFFLKLISLLKRGVSEDCAEEIYPDRIRDVLRYISEHFREPITVDLLAKICNVSVNTLERTFKRYLNLTPSCYLRKKRLAYSLKLLAEGNSVTDAAEKSGFQDYNNYIQQFRKAYGITPLTYKKRIAMSTGEDASD